MKKYLLLLLVNSTITLNLAHAQPVMPPPMSLPDGYFLVGASNALVKFNLNFSGGTPHDLAQAIEKATGKPLNTVIPEENANLKIPALSVKNVNVAQLFEVLRDNSAYKERDVWRAFSDSTHQETLSNPITYYGHETSYGFRTTGVPNDDSIWYFYCDHDDVQVEPKVCRFFQLKPYLTAGYTVENITTTIQTGWKMLGLTTPPEISYNQGTKVLIAVGQIDKVDLIGDLLNHLSVEQSHDQELAKY